MRVNASMAAIGCLILGLVAGAVTGTRLARSAPEAPVTLAERLTCAQAAERYEKVKLQSNGFYMVSYGRAEFSPSRQSCILDFTVWHQHDPFHSEQYEIDDTITGEMLFNETCSPDKCGGQGARMLADQKRRLEELSR
jgi:hypothetical protein